MTNKMIPFYMVGQIKRVPGRVEISVQENKHDPQKNIASLTFTTDRGDEEHNTSVFFHTTAPFSLSENRSYMIYPAIMGLSGLYIDNQCYEKDPEEES